MAEPPISISIVDSVVGGDVVAGDKVVNVHIHADKLTSEAAVVAELVRHGNEAASADDLVQRLLKNSLFLQKFDAARSAEQDKEVDEQVARALAEYERIGPSPETLKALNAMASDRRNRGQFVAYAKIATLILQFYDRDLANLQTGLRLAEELVAVLREHPDVKRYVALVRAYQAKHLFFKYTDGFLRLRTALAVHAQLGSTLPLSGLVEKQRGILGNRHLADAYMREAIDTAVESGDAALTIAVLFEAEHVQEHGYFLERHLLRRDGSEQADRVFRLLKFLEEMAGKFGDAKEVALVRLNAAHFHLQREEFEAARTLAISTAREFTRLGQAYYASKALDVADAAERKEPPVPPPPSGSGEDTLRAMSGEQFEETMREVSARMLELAGISLAEDKELKILIERAWRDLNPERVMRSCEHLVLRSTTSPLGRKIALATLGTKSVACAKYGGEIEGVDLDGAFALFKSLYCNACAGRSPRPPNWKWSPSASMPQKPQA